MLISSQSNIDSTASHIGPAAQDAGSKRAVDGASAALSQSGGTRAAAAGVEFEAMFLRQFVEAVMPDKSAGVFGGGTAGGMWRSLLADGIAKVIAEDGLLGLAKYVAPPESSSLEKKDT